ncbi:hypothetical protein H6P81_017277 [Aristolochia fimbriata]|uniref:t-SNARE coiled-coil homology domain-containing protein n=1 Tax=Aristolochia fimbriata TaxID=158543 RepID=A0AAV7E206_ARIFI|nr:hypothetical protein H6P81_017277 [Aristolochia fimbriata]
MTVIDLLIRVDEICKRYDKYDVEKQRNLHASSNDPFAQLFACVEDDIEAALTKAEAAAVESNRAAQVAMNAEIRRTKARLLEEVKKLQKLALKKVKGLSKEELADRADLVLALPERINAIPDGTNGGKNKGGWGGSASRNAIKFDATSDDALEDGFFHQSEESSQFRQEYDERRKKQDQGLEIISDGLDVLKNLAHDMNEELDRQVPLIDEIDSKVDKANADLKNANVRLKQTINQMRSTRNFCIDITLLCVILGIAGYLYNILKD